MQPAGQQEGDLRAAHREQALGRVDVERVHGQGRGPLRQGEDGGLAGAQRRQELHARSAPQGEEQDPRRRLVDPLQVIDGDQHRPTARQRPESRGGRHRDGARLDHRLLGAEEEHVLQHPLLGEGQMRQLAVSERYGEEVAEHGVGPLCLGARRGRDQAPPVLHLGTLEGGPPHDALADPRLAGDDDGRVAAGQHLVDLREQSLPSDGGRRGQRGWTRQGLHGTRLLCWRRVGAVSIAAGGARVRSTARGPPGRRRCARRSSPAGSLQRRRRSGATWRHRPSHGRGGGAAARAATDRLPQRGGDVAAVSGSSGMKLNGPMNS